MCREANCRQMQYVSFPDLILDCINIIKDPITDSYGLKNHNSMGGEPEIYWNIVVFLATIKIISIK